MLIANLALYVDPDLLERVELAFLAMNLQVMRNHRSIGKTAMPRHHSRIDINSISVAQKPCSKRAARGNQTMVHVTCNDQSYTDSETLDVIDRKFKILVTPIATR